MNVSINYTIAEIARQTGGKLVLQNDSLPSPDYLLLDSRKILFPANTIFCAIRTSTRNGKDFVEGLYEKGVRNFLVEDKSINPDAITNVNVILVENTTEALQLLAAAHRTKYELLPNGNQLPVIGITGSNGKTIVKEWLAHLLEGRYSIVRNPGSYNSQIGVPLSVLNINPSHTLGLFEAGISAPGEMEKLEKIIRPTVGVFTNIGEAHAEGFVNIKEKIREKLSLFIHSNYLVYPADDPLVKKEVLKFQKQVNKKDGLKLFSWGKEPCNDLHISSIQKKRNSTIVTAMHNGKNYSIAIPFADDASIENAVTCWSVLILLHNDQMEILEKFSSLYPISMRLELKQGVNNCTIINDSYSNDLHSLSIAVNFLTQQRQHKKRSIILSDILQSGREPKQLYSEVAALLVHKNIDQFIGVGPEICANRQVFDGIRNRHFFLSVNDLLKKLFPLHFHNENILVKGARSFGFEQVVAALEQKVHQTILSIDLKAVVHNLKIYKQLLAPSTKIMGMVKAFSYGSGSYEIASVLENEKIDYLAVAYTDEGVDLRKAGISLPTMIMNVEPNTFPLLVAYNLEPEMFSFSILHEFQNFLKSNGINNYPVHLKIDTGMHRLGFTPAGVHELTSTFAGNSVLKIKSVFTHLVASEDAKHDSYTTHQLKIFKECTDSLRTALDYDFYKHAANTSAISRHPNAQMDMVRLGIGLYGIDNNRITQKQLSNVTTLTTTISQVKKVKAGETVGYGRSAKLERDSVIGTVRIGYADGYSRSLGNGIGKMLVQNKLVPVVGNVCMDMTMLDITGLDTVHEGENVLVFGDRLPLTTLAKWADTIPYEIMTGISQRVKRVYFEE